MSVAHRQQPSVVEQEIQRGRKALKPSRVVWHRIPDWLRTRLREAQDAGLFQGPDGKARYLDEQRLHAAVDRCRQGGRGLWMDHWGTTDYRVGDPTVEVFVSEPYNIDMLDLHSVLRFAAMLGLAWRLDPLSWHYPGRTQRIAFVDEQGSPVTWNRGSETGNSPLGKEV